MPENLPQTDDIEALRRLASEAWQRAEALQKQADAAVHQQQQLQAENQQLSAQNQTLSAQNRVLENDLAVLLHRISELTRKLAVATSKDEQLLLELELRILRQRLNAQATETYGTSSERRSGTRDTAQKKDKDPQRGHGPTKQPNLPIVLVVHHLDAPDCTCPKCGGDLREMAEQFETTELVVSIRRSFAIEQHKCQKYHCHGCGHIDTALGPQRLIPGGRYDLSFAVQVALDKYLDALPLERQVRRMGRAGLKVTSQTLWDQLLALYTLLLPTWLALKDRVLEAEVVHADETRWRMMGPGKSTKWWLWTLVRDDSVYFELFPNRGNAAARILLDGYDGIVMADGYTVYASLEGARDKRGGEQLGLSGAVERLPNYVLALCWAHARRPLFKAEKSAPEAGRALDLIATLYAIESEATEAAAGDPMALRTHRRRLRAERSRAVIAELDSWRKSQRVLPRSQFAKGIDFLDNHWTTLTRFLDDPRIPLDNGEAEREIRGPVIGRKNFYGNRSEAGARVAGLFYSLIGTATRLGLDPDEYLMTAATRALLRPGTVTLPHDYQAELAASV